MHRHCPVGAENIRDWPRRLFAPQASGVGLAVALLIRRRRSRHRGPGQRAGHRSHVRIDPNGGACPMSAGRQHATRGRPERLCARRRPVLRATTAAARRELPIFWGYWLYFKTPGGWSCGLAPNGGPIGCDAVSASAPPGTNQTFADAAHPAGYAFADSIFTRDVPVLPAGQRCRPWALAARWPTRAPCTARRRSITASSCRPTAVCRGRGSGVLLKQATEKG